MAPLIFEVCYYAYCSQPLQSFHAAQIQQSITDMSAGFDELQHWTIDWDAPPVFSRATGTEELQSLIMTFKHHALTDDVDENDVLVQLHSVTKWLQRIQALLGPVLRDEHGEIIVDAEDCPMMVIRCTTNAQEVHGYMFINPRTRHRTLPAIGLVNLLNKWFTRVARAPTDDKPEDLWPMDSSESHSLGCPQRYAPAMKALNQFAMESLSTAFSRLTETALGIGCMHYSTETSRLALQKYTDHVQALEALLDKWMDVTKTRVQAGIDEFECRLADDGVMHEKDEARLKSRLEGAKAWATKLWWQLKCHTGDANSDEATYYMLKSRARAIKGLPDLEQRLAEVKALYQKVSAMMTCITACANSAATTLALVSISSSSQQTQDMDTIVSAVRDENEQYLLHVLNVCLTDGSVREALWAKVRRLRDYQRQVNGWVDAMAASFTELETAMERWDLDAMTLRAWTTTHCRRPKRGKRYNHSCGFDVDDTDGLKKYVEKTNLDYD